MTEMEGIVANKRMIAKPVISTDTFLEMSLAAQALYFQLQIEADEYGFISAPKKIVRGCMRSDDDLRELIDNGYCYLFPSGHLVMLHWLMANKYEKKREPTFKEEYSLLTLNDDLSYNPPGNAGQCRALSGKDGTSVSQSVSQSVSEAASSSSSSTVKQTVTKINDYITSCGIKIPATEIQGYLEAGLEPIVIVWAADAAGGADSPNAYFRKTINDKILKEEKTYERLRENEYKSVAEAERFDRVYGERRHDYDGGEA